MSVEQSDVIDIVTHNPATNEVILVMAEIRNWNSVPVAVSQLETKFSGYADYVLSGSLVSQHPAYEKCKVGIRLVHVHSIPPAVASVLRIWAGKLSGIPIAVWSELRPLSPVSRFVQKTKEKFGGQRSGPTRWLPNPDLTHPLLTHAEFTEEFLVAFQRAAPVNRFEKVRDLEIKVIDPNGKENKIFLDNAHLQFKAAPENKDDIIRKYVGALLDVKDAKKGGIDRSLIVPVIKDAAWIFEINASLKAKGEEKTLEQLFEPYNEDLIIVYAEDSPRNIQFLRPGDLATLGLEMPDLRKLAAENLERLLPPPDVIAEQGIYRIKAGGDYDASLLLVDALWKDGKIPVRGEIVAAIPARDFLFVTGSEDAAGLKRLREIAHVVAAKASYRLTSKLFIYRNGAFEVFNPR